MSQIVNEVEIRVKTDGSGVAAGLRPAEEAITKTGKSLENLGATAKKTGKAIDDIGAGPGFTPVAEGADAAAGKMDRATARMADSIKRTTQATESLAAGAKGTAANFAALAEMRGLNRDALKPLLDQLDAATRKANLAAEAQRKLDDSTKFLADLRTRADGIGKTASQLAEMRAAQLGVSDSAAPMIAKMREAEKAGDSWSTKLSDLAKDKLKNLALAITAAAAAAAAGAGLMLKSAIDDLGELDDMAQKTGASVEGLSRIQKVVTVFGPDMESVNGALNKLAKGMATVDDESNKTQKALGALGLSSKDATGKLRDPAQVLVDVAKKLQDYSDGAAKTALITDLVGKSGADLLPFLNDLAENYDKVSGVSAEAAASAAHFQDELGWMKLRTKELYTAIASDALPALGDLAGAFLDAKKAQTDLKDGDVTEWADDLALGIARVADVAALLPKIFGAVGGSFKVVAADIQLAATVAENSNPIKAALKVAKGGSPLQEIKDALAARNKVLEAANSKYDELWNKPANSFEQAFLKRVADRAKAASAPVAEPEKSVLNYETGNDPNEKKREAAFKKETEAYAGLIAAIQSKIEEDKLEMAVGVQATEAQKLQIKFDQEILSGKLKLTPEHQKAAQAKLDELAATEKLLQAEQAQREVTKYIAESTAAREQMAAALDVEYAMYGKGADARATAMVALDAETWKEKELAKLREDKKPITDQIINQLNAEAKARVLVGQAALGQTQALKYAAQLEEENKKFGLQYIADDRQRAAAQLALDSEVWQERIRLAGEGTEAQKILQQNFDTWYRNQSIKPQLEEEKKMWASIEQTAHDTFISIFDSGKSAFDRLRDALKNGLLDLLYQMTLKKWIVNIGASVGMTGTMGIAQAAGVDSGAAGAGPIGAAQSAASLYSAVTGGFAKMGAAVTNGIDAALGQIGPGTIGSAGPSAIASTAGQVVPYVAAAVASYYLAKGIAGGYKVEGIGTVLNYAGIVGGVINRAFGMGEKEVRSQGLRGTLSASGLTGESYQNMHQEGGWFRRDKNWPEVQAFTDALRKRFTEGLASIEAASAGFAQSLGVQADWVKTYSKSFDIKMTGDATKDQQAIADFFSGIGDEIATKLVPNLDELSKSGETASAALERLANDFKGTDQVAQLLGFSANTLFGSTGLDSAKAREQLIDMAGGLQVLGQYASTFNQNFLTDAERIKPVAEALDKALASLGLSTIPTTREEFKGLVNSLILSGAAATEAGAKQLDSLLALGEAFAQVHPDDAAEKAQKAAAILQERQGLQSQLDELTMSSVQLLAKQRDALDESNRALFDQIQLAQKGKAVADERKGLQDQLDELTMSSAQLLVKQRDALDASNQSLFEQIQAVKAQKSAAEEAAAAIQKAKEAAAASLQSFGNAMLDSMNGATAAAKALRDFNDSLLLGNLSALDTEERYRAAKAQYQANPSDKNAAQAFLQAAKDRGVDDFYYQRDFAQVRTNIAAAAAEQDARAKSLLEFWRSYAAEQMKPTVVQAPVVSTAVMSAVRANYAAPAQGGTSGLEDKVQKMSDKLEQALGVIAENTGKTTQILDLVTEGGNNMVNKE